MNTVATEEPNCRKHSQSGDQAAPPSLLPCHLSLTYDPASLLAEPPLQHHHLQPESTVLPI